MKNQEQAKKYFIVLTYPNVKEARLIALEKLVEHYRRLAKLQRVAQSEV